MSLEAFPPPVEPIPAPDRTPPPGRASRLYLLLVFILVATSLPAALLPDLRWLFLLIGDPLLLLAAWLAFRNEKRPARTALRWNWPGQRQVGLGLVLGLGAYALGAAIQILVTLVFGQTAGIDLRRYADDPLILGVFVVSAVILAPLCEEVVFRGYLLGIYERYLGRTGSLWLVSFLFAGLHLQLFGVFSLLPAAFMLTYLAQRSGSLAAGIAAHFAFNLAGTLLGLAALGSAPLVAALLACGLLVVGPVVGGLALIAWRRWVADAPPPTRVSSPASWLSSYAPLLAAGLVYLIFAGLELVTTRYPQVLAGPLPAIQAGSLQAADVTYHSQPLLPLLPPLEITCRLRPQGDEVRLDCRQTQADSLLGAGSSLEWNAVWQAGALELRSADYAFKGSQGSWTGELAAGPAGPATYRWRDFEGSEHSQDLEQGILLDGVWPWQITNLPFERLGGRGAKITWAALGRDGAPRAGDGVVQSEGSQKINVPAGQYTAWNVRVGQETAYFDVQAPHLPIEFTWGGETYQLAEIR